jgi:hypothetical protein
MVITLWAAPCRAEPGVTAVNMLKLRKAPTIEAIAIEAYPIGEKIEVLERGRHSSWVKVKVYSDGKVGYMASRYVSVGGRMPASPVKEQEAVPEKSAAMAAPASTAPAPPDPPATTPKAEKIEKVLTLVVANSDDDAIWRTKYETTLRELEATRNEIAALKAGLSGFKPVPAKPEARVVDYSQRLASMENAEDFLLMSLVELKGEEVMLSGLGKVSMTSRGHRVILKVPAELADRVQTLFATVDNHTFGHDSLYITLDRRHLSFSENRRP